MHPGLLYWWKQRHGDGGHEQQSQIQRTDGPKLFIAILDESHDQQHGGPHAQQQSDRQTAGNLEWPQQLRLANAKHGEGNKFQDQARTIKENVEHEQPIKIAFQGNQNG